MGKLRNLPLKAWSSKGISAIASRLGNPLIIEEVTTSMCKMGNGRMGFARVLIDVEAEKGLPEKIEIVYKNKEGVVTGNKSVNVSYDWSPPMCSFCKVFGNCEKNYVCRPRSVDEFMEMERNVMKNKHESKEFEQVRYKKRGVRKVNQNVENKNSEGLIGKNVVYKPVEKVTTNTGDEIRNEVERGQMKDKGNTKAGGVSNEDSKQFSGEGKSKRKAVTKNQERNKNKFDIRRDYDEEGMNDRGMQNEVVDIEENDVYECSGMESSMKNNEVIRLDTNVLQEC
ncbi:RNA-directed DNA polymerase, eukaryota, reverse transcriptase zinc-binding domain protein [Tanacetum coccineum]